MCLFLCNVVTYTFCTRLIVDLGSSESGKTTVLKQLKIIHGKGLESERQQYRSIVYINILTAMKALTNALIGVGYKLESKNLPHLEKFQKLTSIKDSLNCNLTVQAAVRDQKSDDDVSDLFREHVDSVKALWEDPAIKKCFNSASEIGLQDSAK